MSEIRIKCEGGGSKVTRFAFSRHSSDVGGDGKGRTVVSEASLEAF